LNEPVWLSAETVITINKDLVEETGEPFFLRDRGLLESAVAKPINRFHYDGVEDVLSLAMTLLFGVARNHAFEQGNKRTGFLAAVVFLEANGYTIEPDPSRATAASLVLSARGAPERGRIRRPADNPRNLRRKAPRPAERTRQLPEGAFAKHPRPLQGSLRRR
jgi:death on curing protein